MDHNEIDHQLSSIIMSNLVEIDETQEDTGSMGQGMNNVRSTANLFQDPAAETLKATYDCRHCSATAQPMEETTNVEMLESPLSEAPPSMLEQLRSLAAKHEMEGELMEARSVLEKALSECDSCDFTALAPLFADLGDLCADLRECAQAARYYEDAILAAKKTSAPDVKFVLRCLDSICKMSIVLQHYGHALNALKDIYDIQLELWGPMTLELSSTLTDMGLMHYLAGGYSMARNMYEEALRIRLGLVQESSQDKTTFLEQLVCETLNAIALVSFKLGNRKLSEDAFRSCLSMRLALHGDCHIEVALAWYNLGMILIEAGHRPEGIANYKQGLAIHANLIDNDNPSLSTALQYLGETYQDNGEFEESLEYFKAALRLEKIALKQNEKDACRLKFLFNLLNTMGNVYLFRADIDNMMESFASAARVAIELYSTGNGCAPLIVAGHGFCQLSREHPLCPAVA